MGSWLGLWSLGLGLGRRWAVLKRFWAGKFKGVEELLLDRHWSFGGHGSEGEVDSTTNGAGVWWLYSLGSGVWASNNDIRRIAKGSKWHSFPFSFPLLYQSR